MEKAIHFEREVVDLNPQCVIRLPIYYVSLFSMSRKVRLRLVKI